MNPQSENTPPSAPTNLPPASARYKTSQLQVCLGVGVAILVAACAGQAPLPTSQPAPDSSPATAEPSASVGPGPAGEPLVPDEPVSAPGAPAAADVGDAGSAAADALQPPEPTGTIPRGTEPDASYADSPFFTQSFEARRALPQSAPARRIANLSPAACRAELARARLSVKTWGGPAKGVATPLRLTGPIAGVRFIAPGGTSPYGVLDCRLVLALVEFAQVLVRFEVERVQLDNMYRPASKLPRARRRGRPKPPSQHAHGLAADITQLWLKGGEVLRVEQDWQGAPGEPACGSAARLLQATAKAIALRNIVCAVAEAGVFTHMLTPGHDAAHRDHFHFDIKRDATYQAVR